MCADMSLDLALQSVSYLLLGNAHFMLGVCAGAGAGGTGGAHRAAGVRPVGGGRGLGPWPGMEGVLQGGGVGPGGGSGQGSAEGWGVGGGTQGCTRRGGGIPPPPSQGARPMPNHCFPDAKCQLQCRL